VLFRCAASVLPGSALAALLPLYARGTLHLSSAGFGLLLGCMGLGALLAAWKLPAMRARTSPDRLLTLGALTFASALVGLYAAASLIPAALGMVIAGVGWMTMLSGLNVAAQLATASWVRARVLSVYLLVFQGGLALGSLVWGEVATRQGIRRALLVAAAMLAASLVARLRYPLEIVEEDMTLSLEWPMPKIVRDLEDEDGPVRVLIEYLVPEANAREFGRLLRAREQRRRRDGAIEWDLYRDVSQATRWLETFVVDSWGEHERQHGRTTAADRRSSARIAALLEPGTSPTIGHFIAAPHPPGAHHPGEPGQKSHRRRLSDRWLKGHQSRHIGAVGLGDQVQGAAGKARPLSLGDSDREQGVDHRAAGGADHRIMTLIWARATYM